MSWKIARKNDKYRIWSTVSDAWMTDWVSRNEAIKIYRDDALIGFKKKVIEQFYKFPHMSPNHDDKVNYSYIGDDEGCKRLLEWMSLLSSTKDYDEYVKLVDETYDKIVKEIDAPKENS